MMNKFPLKKDNNSHIIKKRVEHNWSEYQKNVFRSIASGSGHLIVEAYAGSAKTTSIIESFRYVPRGKRVLALAFNKIIASELKSRAPSYVQDVLTFHALGYRSLKQKFGNIELDEYKVQNILKEIIGDEKNYDLIDNLCQTISFCKYSLQDTPKQIDEIIDRFGIDLCEMDRGKFISLVVKTLGINKKIVNKINFDDMCFMPFVHNLSLGTYQYIYCDEFQDANKSQLVMAKKACDPNGGRIIAVLDPNQALYSWRCADTTILEDLKQQEGTKTLPLPISYRCPKSIIELAQNWVPDITCPETAIEGEIKDISLNELYKLVRPGCFILSRTNAPLIKICMTLISKYGIKANIRGRDIGKQLGYLIKKSKKKRVDAFLKWLEKWKDEEVVRLQAKRINTENTLDRYECLVNLCAECKTLEEVADKVDELFNDTDENNIVILSSVHRAKGLERNDVFVLRWTFRVWFDQMHLIEKPNEEANIAYVAVSRSRKKLFVVHKAIV